MFGNPMKISLVREGKEHEVKTVILAPIEEHHMPEYAIRLRSRIVQEHTNMMFCPTLDQEMEWWKKCATTPDHVYWGIFLEGGEDPIGSTSIHSIRDRAGSGSSGVMLVDSTTWGKGVATRAHLGRTYFAAFVLGLNTIKSQVRFNNPASRKALEGVGYRVSGQYDFDSPDEKTGYFQCTYTLTWANPMRISILCPNGIPDFMNESLKRAQIALETAQKSVKFI